MRASKTSPPSSARLFSDSLPAAPPSGVHIANIDGASRGNPGPAAVGAVLMGEDGKVLKEISEYIGEATNNYAEYEALIRALKEAKKIFGAELRDMGIEVRMDSELVVRQLSGLYKVKEPTLKNKFAEVARIRLEDAPHMIFTHVLRGKNAHADELVNRALDASR